MVLVVRFGDYQEMVQDFVCSIIYCMHIEVYMCFVVYACCKCTYILTYMCMCVYHVQVYVRTYINIVCMHTVYAMCECAYMDICTYVHICVHMYVRTHLPLA